MGPYCLKPYFDPTKTVPVVLFDETGNISEIVDQALRSVRMGATRHAALVLCGDDDLVPIARALHRRSRGPERPFIVCDPRRHQSKETVRSAENHVMGLEALAAAIREWEQQWGAELVASWGTMLQFVVSRQPNLGEQAWQLALQLLAVGGSLQSQSWELALAVTRSDAWFLHDRP